MKHTFDLLHQYHRAFQNPKSRIVVIFATILYLASPIDILPEFLLGPIGFIDDTLLIIMFFAEISALVWKNHQSPKNTSHSQKSREKSSQEEEVIDVEPTQKK
jgi:uncharacterized membrane protein YkvA (DUF1232 family)